MKTVWKFPLETMDRARVSMPYGSQILSFQSQYNVATIWALVDTNAPMVEREFLMVGTGHQHPVDAGAFIGTFQVSEGMFVFHVFEVVK